MPTLAYFGIESSGVTVAIDLLIVFGVLLYLALIYWTYLDARRRILDPMLVGCAAAVSLFPFVGTLLYLVVRPPETLEDARERELDVETTRLRLHQLESSLCPHCDYPIEADYVRCPSCLRKLKERCKKCSRPLDRAWTICPFCETEIPARSTGSRRGAGKRGARSRPGLERELASGEMPRGELAGAASDGNDGRESAVRAESAAAQRNRASASQEEHEAAVSGSRPRPGERPRPAGAPRSGSAF